MTVRAARVHGIGKQLADKQASEDDRTHLHRLLHAFQFPHTEITMGEAAPLYFYIKKIEDVASHELILCVIVARICLKPLY